MSSAVRIEFSISILDLSLSIDISILTCEFSSEIDTFRLARKKEGNSNLTIEFFIH